MFSGADVIKSYRRMGADALQTAISAGREAYLLFLPWEDEITEEAYREMVSMMEDPKVLLVSGRAFSEVSPDPFTKAVLSSAYPEESRVFGTKEFYLEGKRLFFLTLSAPVLIRREVLDVFGGIPARHFSLPFSYFSARILFGGFSVGYSKGASVPYEGKITGKVLKSLFFRIGVMEKHDIQTFGWNVPLQNARMGGSVEPLIWPDTGTFIKICTTSVRNTLKAQKRPFLMLKAMLLGISVEINEVLGKKYLYLPQKWVERRLRNTGE